MLSLLKNKKGQQEAPNLVRLDLDGFDSLGLVVLPESMTALGVVRHDNEPHFLTLKFSRSNDGQWRPMPLRRIIETFSGRPPRQSSLPVLCHHASLAETMVAERFNS